MIKFTGINKESGRVLLGLGLTDENIKRLKTGQPIMFPLEEVLANAEIDVLIFHGTDETQIEKELQKHIGPGTKVRRPEE